MIEKPPVDPETYRMVGAAMGALNGVLFLWPKTFRELLARSIFSGFTGYVLYYVPIQLLKWSSVDFVEYQNIVMGGAMVMAFLSWPLAGILIKRAGAKLSG